MRRFFPVCTVAVSLRVKTRLVSTGTLTAPLAGELTAKDGGVVSPPPEEAVVPVITKSTPAVARLLKYQVPPEPDAVWLTTRKVATVCRDAMPERSIAAWGLPVPLVTAPQVIGPPMSVKVPAPSWYCHCPIVAPDPERRTL